MTNTELEAENARLRELLADAAMEIAEWGSYASAYFQEKHGLAVTVKKFEDAALAGRAHSTSTEAAKPVAWHAPGLGEVHNPDHTKMIYCYKTVDEQDRVDDDLAKFVCGILNTSPQPSADALDAESLLQRLESLVERRKEDYSDGNIGMRSVFKVRCEFLEDFIAGERATIAKATGGKA